MKLVGQHKKLLFPAYKRVTSPVLLISAGPKGRAGGFGGPGAQALGPPSTLSGDRDQHEILEQYPAYVPSTDLTLNSCLISGFGQKTSDSCGSGLYTRMVHCSKNSEHDHYQVGGSSCGDPECPVCWSMWAHRGADRISCRVDGFKRFARYSPRHIILSLRPDEVALDKLCDMPVGRALEILKDVFRSKAAAVGVTGGALIIHLWRTNEKVPRNAETKKWQWVRDQGKEKFAEYVIFEPHAHIAGYGFLKTPKKGEFLYKNKGYLRLRDDIERWAYYALSHCPIVPGKAAVTYFGCCSYNKLKHTWMNRLSVPVRCEVCGAPMIYEGTNEELTMRRTFATWIFLKDERDETMLSSGPPN